MLECNISPLGLHKNLIFKESCTAFGGGAGLSKFFGVPLVPGLVQSQVGKSGAMIAKSRLYSLGHPQYIVWSTRSDRVFFSLTEEKK